jgi:gamma-glutamylputrescine oxidase
MPPNRATTLPAYPPTLYQAGARAQPRPPLQGSQRVEVAIVGGGLTGLGAALALAEQGAKPLLLEAHRIGWGASGRNGGQLLPGLGGDLAAARHLYGSTLARSLFDLTVEAVDAVKQRIGRHGIACGLAAGHVTAAVKRRHMGALAAERALWQDSFGYGGLELWSEEALRAVLHSPRFIGGLYDPNAAHLDPLAYTLALGELAAAAGAVLHEGSPVLRIEPGSPMRLATSQGEVRADRVLLCGNAYLGGLVPELAGEIMPVTSCVIATAPLGRERMASLFTRPIAVADAHLVVDYFRPTPDHRLIFGGRANYAGREPRDIERLLRPRLERVFPQLAGVAIAHRWAGRIAITRDRLPRLGRFAPNGLYAHGYSGHGLALAGLAGQILAEACLGSAQRLEIFSALPRRRFPGGILRTPALVLAMLYFRLRDLI